MTIVVLSSVLNPRAMHRDILPFWMVRIDFVRVLDIRLELVVCTTINLIPQTSQVAEPMGAP